MQKQKAADATAAAEKERLNRLGANLTPKGAGPSAQASETEEAAFLAGYNS